ncbi:Uncharacterized protein YAE1 [Tolypocladium ophioglossoides CBS 100239]|uniref:Protein YAE1 n=1 Tax=Tolypocladium ophioglossoides (strain CBS 100239) TaxID=1163406 RepID=A0A0L0N280_TOLOC|nr:Uncharacterized protein YAE1 [Tolypocladium ophioglossoides CBS 100239]
MHFQPIEPSAGDAYLSQAEGGGAVSREPEPSTALDPFDDVFGSTPASPTEHRDAQSAAHPSDMRRLQTEHATAGYREGVTAAKDSSMQSGFDEGFSLGATIGQRAGQLLGTLEGVSDAFKGQTSEAALAAEKLLTEAHEELSTTRIVSPEYWAPDGNWTFEVKAGEGEDVLFPDVANAHPLIRKWNDIVDEHINLWKINPSILDDDTGPRLDAMADEPLISSAPPAAKKPLDW